MAKVVDCFHIGKYAIIIADKTPARYSKVKINGIAYPITIPYDIPNAIAIESAENFSGRNIEFIK